MITAIGVSWALIMITAVGRVSWALIMTTAIGVSLGFNNDNSNRG